MKKLIALGLLMPAIAMSSEDIDERSKMDADGKVTVSNVAGSIDVSTWDEDEVHLTGELDDQSKLTFTADGGNVTIKVEGKSRNQRNMRGTDLVLRVPVNASLSITGVSADIEIDDSEGESIRAESVSGDVEVSGDTQRLDLTSVSGDVVFSGSSPRTSAETVSGDIDLDGIWGEVNVSLISGDVDLNGGEFSSGRFESVSGSLELVLSVADDGRIDVESMSGDSEVMLPADQEGEFRAQTFSGDIRSEFGSPQREKHGQGTSLRHSTGRGGALITLETFSGDIEIGHK